MITPIQAIDNDELKTMKVRIAKLAKQVNEYIQLNGCSKELKKKSDKLLGPVKVEEKKN